MCDGSYAVSCLVNHDSMVGHSVVVILKRNKKVIVCPSE